MLIIESYFQIMQAIRQSLMVAIQRRITFVRSSLIAQPVRYDASDSHSKENQKQSAKPSDPNKGSSNLNKTKTTEKKPKTTTTTTDDTKQPGVTRKDWNNPNQVTHNDPPYGKAGGSIDTHDPNRGKKA